ncbi:MAG TPA: hypothetical protein VJS15_08605 [Allosphingosinicella sp.]|nr:hypothetical protein [Allosphingosinicella sp.]
MTRRGFPQYAKLWQEQIGPDELSQFQVMAKTIERTARWRSLIDHSLWVLAVGAVCAILWLNATSLEVKLGFALLVGATTWFGWRRHEITKASRSIAVDDPRIFFDGAIRNVRAEISLSTISLTLGPPFFFVSVFLTQAADGVSGFDWMFEEMSYARIIRTIAISAFFLLCGAYFVRDNIRLRGQLRRLEGMSREWEDQPARDARQGG